MGRLTLRRQVRALGSTLTALHLWVKEQWPVSLMLTPLSQEMLYG